MKKMRKMFSRRARTSILVRIMVVQQNVKVITRDFFTALNEEIGMLKKKGVTLVQGDLNARTGNSKDFISLTPEEKNFWMCAN